MDEGQGREQELKEADLRVLWTAVIAEIWLLGLWPFSELPATPGTLVKGSYWHELAQFDLMYGKWCLKFKITSDPWSP